jgi:hypothetical protein
VSNDAAVLSPPIELHEIARVPVAGAIDNCSVDAPQTETTLDSYVLPIAGWIHASAAAPVSVHIASEGRRIATAPVEFPRRDVAAHLSLAEDLPLGFMTSLNVLGLPRNFELTLTAELADGSRVPFAVVHGERSGPPPKPTSSVQPIFVTNIGRCGSTLMMNLLRAHPQIVVHDLYPYETRVASYWMHMLKVLSGPADHRHSAHPNSFEDDPYWVGRNIHNMWPTIEPAAMHQCLRRDYVDRLAEFCQASIDEFYAAVTRAQDVEEPVYFAEKRNPRGTARIASELYPDGREIFLVREPRDMVCSMISFYEKTRLVSFGREQSGSDEEFIGGIQLALRDLVRHLGERREQSIVVRYEDLIAETQGTLARVLEYLDLPGDAALQESIVAAALQSTSDSQRHRTTADAASSIGRWRRDLPPPMQELCTDAFGELIEGLGYEL